VVQERVANSSNEVRAIDMWVCRDGRQDAVDRKAISADALSTESQPAASSAAQQCVCCCLLAGAHHA
jgi:hypothetical protein